MPRKRSSCRSRAPEEDSNYFEEEGEGEESCPEKPVQRNAANARERARMRVLSKAFCRLKTTLPWVPADTKLSKLDTLRLATSYIAHLRSVLCLPDDTDCSSPQEKPVQSVHPLNLTWPYSFQFHVSNGSSGSNSSLEDWKQKESRPHCAKILDDERRNHLRRFPDQYSIGSEPVSLEKYKPPRPSYGCSSDASPLLKFETEESVERHRRYDYRQF